MLDYGMAALLLRCRFVSLVTAASKWKEIGQATSGGCKACPGSTLRYVSALYCMCTFPHDMAPTRRPPLLEPDPKFTS